MKLPREVYMIRHSITGRIYIGSSADVEKRYLCHLYALRSGKHPVEDMQKDFDEHGERFTFTVLDQISTIDESEKEYEWMREFKSHIRGVGYNYKDNVFSVRPRVQKKQSKKEKAINEINDLMLKTNDIDLLDLIYTLLEKSLDSAKCS